MKLAAIALIVALSTFGISPDVVASGEEEREPVRQLTLDGQPLVWLLYPASVSPHTFAAGASRQLSGDIIGIALGPAGQPLSDHTVTLRLADSPVVVATTTSDAEGRFAFSGLRPGQYVVEVTLGTEAIGTSRIVRVTEGGMTFAQIGGTDVSSGRHRKGILYWTAVGAGVGGGIGLLTMFRDECRYPESLCPLAPIVFAETGAIVGFFIGLVN